MTLSCVIALLLLEAPQASDSQQARVYAAILDGQTGTDTILLVDSSYVSTLRPGGVAPLPHRIPTRRPIRFVSLAEVRDSLTVGAPGTYWQRFRQRFPGSRGWYALSPIRFENEGRTAIVYYEWHCGFLCGEGGALTLTLDGTTWRVTDKRRSWVN